jgi:uncharacterized protein with PIN domain
MSRLLLDVMCGKLATYLRMCGYDAAYALDLDEAEDAGTPSADVPDDALLAVASGQGRRVVTRDRDLAARARESVLLESREIEDQLREFSAAGFDISIDDEPTYCGACNGLLERVGSKEQTPEYAPEPATIDVWRCKQCGQYFWKGGHWDDVAETVAPIED